MPSFKFNPFTGTFDLVTSSVSELSDGTTGTGAIVLADSPALTTSPTAPTQAPKDNSTKIATTAYVENAVLGQNFKEACKYGSTAALPAVVYANGSSGVGATLTAVAFGALSFDGSTPSIGDRILIKNQVSTFQNGIYIVTIVGAVATLFVLTRATDFDQSSDIETGDSTFVTAGTTQSATTWAYTGIDAPTMGTSAITFVQTAGQGSLSAGLGITITGNSIAVTPHALLDGSIDSDTLAGAVTRGDIIIGNATPKWARVAKGSANQVLTSDGTDVAWATPASASATEQTTTSTGTQDNFSLSASVTYLRCNNASALTFDGFTVGGNAPAAGAVVIIDNVGSSTVKVAHQNTGSTAANRVICPSTNGQIIGAGGRMQLIYDATTSRWREEIIEPGTAITIPFNAADFTGNISMTWTLDSADLVGATYVQRGTQLLMNVIINSSTVGGTPNNELRMALPGGFTGAGTATLIFFQRDNGTARTGLAQMLNSGTYVQLFKSDFTNYAASTNNNDQLFSFLFGVN